MRACCCCSGRGLILTGLLGAEGAAAASGCLAAAKLAPELGLLPVSWAGKLENLLAPPEEEEDDLGRSDCFAF